MDVAALRTAIRGLRLGQRLRTATDVRDQTPRPGSSTRSPAGRARPAPGSAPSPGSPAQPHRAFAATTSSHRPRIVLEPSPKVPASFPQQSHHAHAARRTPLCPPTRGPRPHGVSRPCRNEAGQAPERRTRGSPVGEPPRSRRPSSAAQPGPGRQGAVPGSPRPRPEKRAGHRPSPRRTTLGHPLLAHRFGSASRQSPAPTSGGPTVPLKA